MDYNDLKIKKAAEVVQSFITISKTLTNFTRKNAESLGLTMMQMGILNSVCFSPGITLKELTEKMLMPKSTTSVSIDELVNLGLIERKQSESDRRKISLNVTEKGKELSKKSVENPASYIAMVEALQKFEEEDIEELLSIHKKLLDNLE